MKSSIRRACYQDAKEIIHVLEESIKGLCSKDYTSFQIEAWTKRKHRPELWCQTIDRDYVWVFEKKYEVVGFGHFAIMSKEYGEVMGLYFSPSAAGHGMGKRMFQEILVVARENHLSKINLHSTLTAKTFYENLGFSQTGENDNIEMQGVPIPCIPMTYNL